MQGTSAYKYSHPAQWGGIETAVIDNGPERGQRIAWINTGSGLRVKVYLDRAMDLGGAYFNQYGLAWLQPGGIRAPQLTADRGLEWLKTFGGGLLTTCGLTHVGGPETDEFGERGLHGSISHQPATIESIIQPDPANGKLRMSITGVILQSQIFGPSLELRRTISATLGSPVIELHDVVLNRANTTVPHMLLYHCNLGWPLLDAGAQVVWKNRPWFDCPEPQESHKGTGEAVTFIEPAAEADGTAVCGLYNPAIELLLAIRFNKQQLPWLTHWQHWGPEEYVTGLEPGTHPPIGQAKARAEKSLIFLEPGESRTYQLQFEILHQPTTIQPFLQALTI